MNRTSKIIWGVFISFISLWIIVFVFVTSSRVEGERQVEDRLNTRIQKINQKNSIQQSTKPDAGYSIPAFGKQNVTFAHYSQIQTGMSYEQVVSIIGKQGEEMSQNKIEGVPGVMPSVTTIMYQWVNGNGSNMNAIFQNNKLLQKAQFGLK